MALISNLPRQVAFVSQTEALRLETLVLQLNELKSALGKPDEATECLPIGRPILSDDPDGVPGNDGDLTSSLE
jgi:hypothetical protein